MTQGVIYSDPGTGVSIQVASQAVAEPDPAADWRAKAQAAPARLAGYRTVSIAPVPFRGLTAADWEYTYAGRHVLNRGFISPGGHGNALVLDAPASEFAQARGLFETIAAAYQPR